MSLRARKTNIVFFILGALVLGVVMVYSFGGQELVSQHEEFVMYFGDTVSGLGPGALVEFKGVPIGLVESVHQPGRNQRVPVVVQLNADRLHQQMGALAGLTDPVALAAEVRRGLRAQLEVNSYVTGGMYVELDYHPDAPTAPANESAPGVIPTLPSKAVANLQYMQDTIAWLPTFDFKHEIDQSGNDVDALTAKIAAFPFAEYSQKVFGVLQPVAKINQQSWQRNENSVLERFNQYETTIATANDQFAAQDEYFTESSNNVRQNLAQINSYLADLRTNLQPSAPWFTELGQNMKDFGDQMERLGAKANDLEDKPDLLDRMGK